RQHRGEITLPSMIPLSSLFLEKDRNAPHGLRFVLREAAEIIYAPIFNSEGGYFTSDDVDRKTGLPRQVHEYGARELITGRMDRRQGLMEVIFRENFDIDSYYLQLSFFNPLGRIVMLGGKT